MEKCREKVETAAQQTELLSEEAVEQMSNQELLFLYRESGDEELKWKLVLRMTGMVRAIAAQVEDPAADLMLEGCLKKGDSLQVWAEEGQIRVGPAGFPNLRQS